MKCSQCKNEMIGDAKRCNHCGYEAPKKGFWNFISNMFMSGSAGNAGSLRGGEVFGGKLKSEKNDFVMTVENLFSVKGVGDVLSGKIESGKVQVGDEVVLSSLDNRIVNFRVVGIEQFNKQQQEAKVGDTVGLLVAPR